MSERKKRKNKERKGQGMNESMNKDSERQCVSEIVF